MSVSKGGHAHLACCPSFETPCCARLLRMRWVGKREREGLGNGEDTPANTEANARAKMLIYLT